MEKEIKQWYKNFRHLGFVDAHDAEIHEETVEEKVHEGDDHHSKKHILSSVLHKLNNWFLDGPHIRSFHSNHMELIEHDVEDLEDREKFAKSQLEHVHKWSHIIQSMWFAGEAKFYLDGSVECANHVYTKERKPDTADNLPYKTIKHYTPSSAPYVTVWAAMNFEFVVGPFFFDTDEITPELYKAALEKFVSEIRQVTSGYEHPIFIHDDSKVHTNTNVVKYLDKEFPHHWIGEGSTYGKWPKHSPDLNPINYFLWGYIKSKAYKTPVEDLEELKKRITTIFAHIPKNLLEDAAEDYKTRLERVERTNGNLVDATVYGQEVDYQMLKAWTTYAWPYV